MSLAVQLVFLPFVALLALHPLALFVWVLRGLRDRHPAGVGAAGAWSLARADLREAAVITGCLLLASGSLYAFGAVLRLVVGCLGEPAETGLAASASDR